MPVGDLANYENNSRTHSDEQVSQICASITEFGFTNPVLIDNDNIIIAGHGRLMAAKKLKLEEVPCIRLGHLNDEQRRAYVIADNQLALNAGWDLDALRFEVEQLSENDFNIELLGMDLSFIEDVPDLNKIGLTPEDKLDNYLNGDTKIIRLAYSQDELEQVTAMFDSLLDKHNFNDYSECTYFLLSKGMVDG